MSRPAGPNGRPLVVHVVHRFDVGGLENGVVNLINHLPAERFDHAVVAMTEITSFRQRIESERVGFHAMQKPPGHGLGIHRDLYRLFRKLRPAIVHTRNIGASEAHVSAMLAAVPVRIHGEHGWEVRDVAGGRASHHLHRRLMRPLIHRHIALSGEIRRYLETRIGVPAGNIVQICNGVDVSRFVPRRERTVREGPIAARFGSDTFVVGTVGRLSPVKNQRLLVDAFARAVERVGTTAPARAARMRLIVAGDGPDRGAIEDAVAASGLADRVWLTGARDDVAGLMAAFDLFVLPSLAEGISNTILEAMACGLPVVATRVGGNAELVDDGRTGTLVPTDDVDAMADAIAAYAVASERVDAEGGAARTRATGQFSIETMVARYADVYDTLLARHVRGEPARAAAHSSSARVVAER